MKKQSNKMSFWMVFWTGFICAVMALILHSISAVFSMSYYLMQEYFPVWSKIMMPTAGPPGLSFYVISLLLGIISWMLFAIVYNMLKSAVPGKTIAKQGMVYGLLVYLVGGIPGYLTMYMLINLPAMLILIWAIESLVIYLIAGIITAKINY